MIAIASYSTQVIIMSTCMFHCLQVIMSGCSNSCILFANSITVGWSHLHRRDVEHNRYFVFTLDAIMYTHAVNLNKGLRLHALTRWWRCNSPYRSIFWWRQCRGWTLHSPFPSWNEPLELVTCFILSFSLIQASYECIQFWMVYPTKCIMCVYIYYNNASYLHCINYRCNLSQHTLL